MNTRGLFHAILTCVTAGPGLGFNRAVLFVTDEDGHHLEAAMAIGPGSAEEAQDTWASLEGESKSLEELLRLPPGNAHRTSFQCQIEGLTMALDDDGGTNPLLEAYRKRRVVRIGDEARLDQIPAPLRAVFAGTEVICVPLIAHDRVVGLLVADNAFTRTKITEERIQLLLVLAMLAGQAIDGVRVYRQLERQADELRRTVEELRTTQEHLIRSERLAMVGEVVARVSHEIRNPLSTIGGFARGLAKHPDDVARVSRNSTIIVAEVEKLETLLKEMLDFTSPRPPVLVPCDSNEILEALANVYRDELAERHVLLKLDLSRSLAPVLVDTHQLHRALLNLLQNGTQAMESNPAGEPHRLSLRSWQEGSMVCIGVQDTGRGIEENVLERIFTPFFTTKSRGTGLGLAVVKKIIDDHHGTIDVQTQPGRGTTFVISLPAVG